MSNRPGRLEVIAAQILTNRVHVRLKHASGEVRTYDLDEYLRLPTATVLGSTFLGFVEGVAR